MGKTRAVVFDMDGLLLDSERILLDIWDEVALRYQLALPAGFMQMGIGFSDAVTRVSAFERFGAEFPYDVMRDETIIAMKARIEGEGIPRKAGVEAMLLALEAWGVKKALATSTRVASARPMLEKANLWGRFDAYVFGDDVTRKKPDPETYLLAAQRLGIEPAECLALEDSGPGVSAAAAAGIAVICVVDIAPPGDEILLMAEDVCASLDEALPLVAARCGQEAAEG